MIIATYMRGKVIRVSVTASGVNWIKIPCLFLIILHNVDNVDVTFDLQI